MNEIGKQFWKFSWFVGVALMSLFSVSGFALSSNPVRAAAIQSEVPESGSSNEPIRMIISLKNQRMDVYQGRNLIESSPISSGKRGYDTPSGIFSILQRNRWHRSNIYSNAPMPYMQRLTWSGIALHAGRVPGYPASHGCVRLPKKFATMLFGLTTVGAHVVVAQDRTEPQDIVHRALFQPLSEEEHLNGIVDETMSVASSDLNVWDTRLQKANLEVVLAAHRQSILDRSPAPLRILITRRTGREKLTDIQRILNELGYEAGDVDGYMGHVTATAIQSFQKDHDVQPTGLVSDQLLALLYKVSGNGPVLTGHIYVRQDFEDIFDMPLRINYGDAPLGTYMYSAMYFEDGADRVEWLGLVVDEEEDGSTDIYRALDRVVIPKAARIFISERLTPGTSLIISDEGISRETGRGTDFVVLIN